MLEQRGAGRLVGTADEVGRTVHFHRNSRTIIQSNECVDAVSGGLATMLFLYTGSARTDLSYNIGLQLRQCRFLRCESVTAGLL